MASIVPDSNVDLRDDAPEERRFPSPEHVAKVAARVKRQTLPPSIQLKGITLNPLSLRDDPNYVPPTDEQILVWLDEKHQ